MTIDYQKSTLVCIICGLSQINQVFVASYNHTMQPLRRKCIYKRSDNFKVILNQFFYGGKKLVPPITIPILECILKRNELMIYKDSIYFIFFKISGVPFPCITTKEYNLILNVFNVVSSIYDKYKSKGKKSFLNYSFVLTQMLIMLGKVEYAKYIPPLKTRSKQNELEGVWELIPKDPQFAVALQKQKIA